ncbi:Blue-light-activated protein [Enhygromyxa salina]|uniref:histidine kinase n=1 Tax=Enhygromyxa salina TaxID=215803 RepID=A0A2S9YDP8_9BACT|nr:PAS domain S-box protein [Enhygromyxa salina]PRQ03239.1 Blue-light-activated protein [Enhygromyxa salina]
MPDPGSHAEDPLSSEAVVQSIVEAVPGGVVHVGADGEILNANPEALRVLGLSFNAITNKYAADFETETIHEDGSPCPIADYPVTKALQTGEAQPGLTLGVRRPDGEVSWAVFRASPLTSSTGQIQGAIVTFLDISERIQAEEQHRRDRLLLKKAQELASLGSWEWDPTTNRLTWTDEMFRIHGVDPANFDGRLERVLALTHPDDVERVEEMIREAVNSGETTSLEYRIIRPDGSERIVWGGGQLVRDRYGDTFKVIGALQDVTERRQIERHRRELEERLRQAQRMESVGRLAGGVAHDFNNLLQVILGNLELAELYGDTKEALADIRTAATRAAELTSQLLTFGRRQRVNLVEVEPHQLIADSVRMLRRLLGEHYELVLDLAATNVVVKVDRAQFGQVLINLCINARDAMPQGGPIVVRTSVTEPDEDLRHAWSLRAGADFLRVDVVDTGTGLSEDDQYRVFEPFFTTKPQGEGTGLGLAVAYGVAVQHGGAIALHSVEGEGSTFSVYLPLAEPASALDEAQPQTQPQPQPQRRGGAAALDGKETILLVEDEAMVRSVAERILRQAGYVVLSAGDGVEAMQVFEQRSKAIDLVILDVVMPRMGGYEFHDRIRERFPDLSVIFTTGHDLSPTAALRRPIVRKPYGSLSLLQAVRRELDRGSQTEG